MTKCSFDSCKNASYCKGLCSAHYTQNRRGGPLKPIVIRSDSTKLPCTVNNCKNNQKAKGLCSAHWYQNHYMGKLFTPRNQIEIMDRIMSQVKKLIIVGIGQEEKQVKKKTHTGKYIIMVGSKWSTE
jgi:hypothetical protein